MRASLTTTSFIFYLFLILSFSCSNNSDEGRKDICSISIAESNIMSPDWLVDEIRTITSRSQYLVFVEVYSHTLNDKMYIAVIDPTNSSVAQLCRFFTCLGVEVEFGSFLYQNLFEKYTNGKFYLVWNN